MVDERLLDVKTGRFFRLSNRGNPRKEANDTENSELHDGRIL